MKVLSLQDFKGRNKNHFYQVVDNSRVPKLVDILASIVDSSQQSQSDFEFRRTTRYVNIDNLFGIDNNILIGTFTSILSSLTVKNIRILIDCCLVYSLFNVNERTFCI